MQNSQKSPERYTGAKSKYHQNLYEVKYLTIGFYIVLFSLHSPIYLPPSDYCGAYYMKLAFQTFWVAVSLLLLVVFSGAAISLQF